MYVNLVVMYIRRATLVRVFEFSLTDLSVKQRRTIYVVPLSRASSLWYLEEA